MEVGGKAHSEDKANSIRMQVCRLSLCLRCSDNLRSAGDDQVTIFDPLLPHASDIETPKIIELLPQRLS